MLRDDVKNSLTLLREHLATKLKLIEKYRQGQETLQFLITKSKTDDLELHLHEMESIHLKIEEEDYHAGSLYDEIARTIGTDRMALFQILQDTEDDAADSVLDLEDKIHQKIREMASRQEVIITAMKDASERFRLDADEISRVLRLRSKVKKDP